MYPSSAFSPSNMPVNAVSGLSGSQHPAPHFSGQPLTLSNVASLPHASPAEIPGRLYTDAPSDAGLARSDGDNFLMMPLSEEETKFAAAKRAAINEEKRLRKIDSWRPAATQVAPVHVYPPPIVAPQIQSLGGQSRGEETVVVAEDDEMMGVMSVQAEGEPQDGAAAQTGGAEVDGSGAGEQMVGQVDVDAERQAAELLAEEEQMNQPVHEQGDHAGKAGGEDEDSDDDSEESSDDDGQTEVPGDEDELESAEGDCEP